MEHYCTKENTYSKNKNIVGKDKVICALSGGVDSSVVALLINKAIQRNLICIMVDTRTYEKMNLNILIKFSK